jgi:hypothetical protein
LHLVEFALQGVRRFGAGRKLALGEGYNLLTGSNESGKTTCLLVILATLEPERLEGNPGPLLPALTAGAPVPPPPRCGVVFTHAGRTYRLVRDLVRGAANLGVLDPGSGKFILQQREASAIRLWLREVAGMPARRPFDALFLLERAAMPSARLHGASCLGSPSPATAPSGEAGASLTGTAAPAAAATPLLTGAAREARIAELKAELARIEEMSRIEFSLDGVRARLFELDAEFADVRKLGSLAAELDTAIAEFERLGLDPAQLEARARNFKTLVERREAELAAVEADREAIEARAAAPVTPVVKDRLVLAGAGVTLVCLGVGLWFPAAFAGALAGFGAAAFGTVRDSWAAARRREALAGLAPLEERVQAIEKRFEIETRSVRSAEEALGVSGPEGVLERVEAYRTLKVRREAVEERREALTRQKDFAALEAERGRFTAEVSQLEERLRGFGGTAAFDAGELRRELAVLEGRAAPPPHAGHPTEDHPEEAQPGVPTEPEAPWGGARGPRSGGFTRPLGQSPSAIGQAPGAPSSLRGGPGGGGGDAGIPGATAAGASAAEADDRPAPRSGAGASGGGAAGGGGPLAEAVEAWLEAAARVLGESREGVARELLSKAQPLVAPLTAGRHRSVALDADRGLVAVGADGRTHPAAELSPATQDALYLALRLAGFGLVARARPWPLFLDDPLVALDDVRLAAACRAIGAAARDGGQVLHFAARKLPPALADSAQTLD